MMADGGAWGLRTIREHLTVTCVAYCAPWWVTTVWSTNWDRIFVAASNAGVDWPMFENHIANIAGRMLVSALGGQCRRPNWPISLPPVRACHTLAAAAMVLVLPAPAGAVSKAMARSAVSRVMTAWLLLVVEVLVVPVELVPDLLFGDQRPYRAPGLADHRLFQVEVVQGSPAHGVRLAEDGLPVGLADSEGADVHQVGCRADLHDLCARRAGDGQHGHLGDVGRGGADGQGPVDFQAQVRDPPDASLSLRFGHGDPCGPGLVRVGQPGAGAPSVRRRPLPRRRRR